MNTGLIEYLKEFMSESRWQRINDVLDLRTQHITVVLEDIYQPHNASAVLRSCDGFGIQDVHVIKITINLMLHRKLRWGQISGFLFIVIENKIMIM